MMNIYAIIILAALIIGYLLDIVSGYLNLKSLKHELPADFKDVFDERTYAKSQEYTRVYTRFGFITSTFDLLVLLLFWFNGGFNWLDLQVRQIFESEILRGVAFIGILLFANWIINLPFKLYSTFVIEEKFGFNKTSPKTFVADTLKSIALTVLIGFPLIALIIFIIQNLGEWAFLYAWIAVVIISLLLTYIAPTVFMPLFNKFTPLEEGELRKAIFNFAEKVKFPLKNIFVMDGSKRSTKSNAFFTGFGRNKRIVLYDTLITKHNTGELVAILAHEIGHYKKKHILQGTIMQILHTGIIFLLMKVFIFDKTLFEAFFMDNVSVYAGMIFFGMLYSPVEMFLSIFFNLLSRKNEYEADKFAAENVDEAKSMVNALKKLSKDNLSNLTPHPFYVFLNYSHPPVRQRIEAIEKTRSIY